MVSTTLITESNRRSKERSSETALLTGKRSVGGPKKRGSGKPKLNDECHYCHKKGHWISKCLKRGEVKKKDSGGMANLAVNNLRELSKRQIGHVFMVEGAHQSAKLILDCGATSHMFCDRTFFASYSAATPHETVSVGAACNILVIGQGSVRFRSILPNGFRTVTLHGAHHIPKLAANLVSLGKLQQEGASVASYEKKLSVSLHGDELLRGSLIGNTGMLYHIQCIELQKNATYIATSGSLHLWHR